MIVFRLCKSKYAADLSGKGAELTGGRWNSKGTPLLYTSRSRALCTVEIAVHTPLGNIPDDYCLVTIEIPDNIPVLKLNLSELPMDWNVFPHSHNTQLLGDRFVASARYTVMQVPSAIVQGEFNFLINPASSESKRITIKDTEPFLFDSRLFIR